MEWVTNASRLCQLEVRVHIIFSDEGQTFPKGVCGDTQTPLERQEEAEQEDAGQRSV